MISATPAKPRVLSTDSIRLRYDLIEMLDSIAWAMGFSANAEGLDGVLRPEIERQFAQLAPDIRKRALDRIAEREKRLASL